MGRVKMKGDKTWDAKKRKDGRDGIDMEIGNDFSSEKKTP